LLGLTTHEQLLALAAYATYVVNAAQFVLEAAGGAARAGARHLEWQRPRISQSSAMDAPLKAPLHDALRPTAPSDRLRPTMPTLRERGQREVFCGLTGIVWLHRKIQDAFFLVVGSRTCAHLIQSAAGVMIFAEPRFATRHHRRARPGRPRRCQRRARPRGRRACWQRRPDIKLLFLVGSCPSEVIKLDLSRAAQRLSQRFAAGVRVLNYSGSGIETTFTQGEDACLRLAGARRCRRSRRRAAVLLVVGAAGRMSWKTSSRRAVRAHGHRACALPARHAATRPARRWAPTPAILLAQPFLADTARALEERGARRIAAPFPLGVEGTTLLARRPRPMPLACRRGTFARGRPAAGDTPRAALARHRDALAGQARLLLPDSQLEMPLARFLSRELGMQLVEVGTPYLHRAASAPRNWRCCPRARVVAKGRTSNASSIAAAGRAARSGRLRPGPRQSARSRGS
jgi:light-independent protochlorophyllide reductase subunit N